MWILSKQSRHFKKSNVQQQLGHLGINMVKKLHPECSTWTYPIIYQKNSRRMQYICEVPLKATGHFWVNLDIQDKSSCMICHSSYGYKIKVLQTKFSVCTIVVINMFIAVVPKRQGLFEIYNQCNLITVILIFLLIAENILKEEQMTVLKKHKSMENLEINLRFPTSIK